MTATCRNCGTTLAGRWCHACGQDSRDPVREFGALAAEALDGVFGWDSRLVRSVKLLFAEPGALTAAFIAGQRTRYLGPVRLYLIASLLFFATYSIVVDPVIATIAGLGDMQAGVAGMAYIDRWLPTMMIVILPAFAVVMHLFFRSADRPFVAIQVLVLNFGTISFLTTPVGHLLAFALERAGVGALSTIPTFAAHAVNVVYLWLMVARFLPEVPAAERAIKLLAFSFAMTLLIGGTGMAVAWLLQLARGG